MFYNTFSLQQQHQQHRQQQVSAMGRRKITHQLIQDQSVRKTTFKKRKEGLLKKLHELTILCDLRACAIIYSDYKDEPELWPNRSQVRTLLNQLRQLPVEKRTKYMLDQKDFMRKMIQNAEKKLEKEKMHSRVMEIGLMASENEMTSADYSEELNKAADMLRKRIKVVSERIDELEKREESVVKRISM